VNPASATRPVEALARYVEAHPQVDAYCIAYSGGRDSHVLLHLAAALLARRTTIRLRALYIDHGLSPDSALWAAHVRQACQRLGVPLAVHRVEVRDEGDGPEAAARAARYGAFDRALDTNEHLLLAQHADDQAETFLLQALRGSGPDGLASMPRRRPFGHGVMGRPLITCPSEAIGEYAEQHSLNWVEDPSNAEQRFDRNFLRHEILPLLRKRWPGAVQTLGRSARRSAAASQILLGVADDDLKAVRLRGTAQLSVSELKRLPRERAYNALRLWVRQAGRRLPRLQDLVGVFDELVLARPDSAGRIGVGDYEFRRHADRLFLLSARQAPLAFVHEWPLPYAPLAIPEIDARITREACTAQGIRLPMDGRISLRSRVGGEVIKLGEPGFHKAVKKLLQESGVPPWERERIPLLFVGERLAAVWNIAVASEFRQSPGDEPGAAAHHRSDARGRRSVGR